MFIKPILTLAACIAMPAAASAQSDGRSNPFLEPYNTPYNIPPFEKIQYGDYLPAAEKGIAEYKKEVAAIVANQATPDFDNTILALEKAGRLLNRVVGVFSALDETESCPEMTAISEKLNPMYSQASDEIMMNPELFQRVKSVYDRRKSLNLTPEQMRDVEETYKSFTRSGALLNDADKARLMKVNTELTDLFLLFNKNLLKDTNAFQLWVDDASQLSGPPLMWLRPQPMQKQPARKASGFSLFMPPAVCRCFSMPTTATCAAACMKGTLTLPRKVRTTTSLWLIKSSNFAPKRPVCSDLTLLPHTLPTM